MKYGIEQKGNDVLCANCGNVVASEQNFENFCAKCGAPLTPLAIADFEDFKEATRQALFADLSQIAKQRKTDSFTEIKKAYDADNE